MGNFIFSHSGSRLVFASMFILSFKLPCLFADYKNTSNYYKIQAIFSKLSDLLFKLFNLLVCIKADLYLFIYPVEKIGRAKIFFYLCKKFSDMDHLHLSEQELIRREALDELVKLGIDPFPAETFEVNTSSREILDNFQPDSGQYQDVQLAGRIMSRRIMGNASFAELQDQKGRIQIYIRRDDLCPSEDKTMYNTVFKKLLDIGDIIGVRGFVLLPR
jgi:hypothetical protein